MAPATSGPSLLRPRQRRYRWWLAGAALGAGIAFHGPLAETYAAAYPSDAFERGALHDCALANPGFVRFLSSDRAACYARLNRRVVAAMPATTPAPYTAFGADYDPDRPRGTIRRASIRGAPVR